MSTCLSRNGANDLGGLTLLPLTGENINCNHVSQALFVCNPEVLLL